MANFLLTPWKESLELLKPKNLSLLLLVSLKSFFQMYSALFSGWFIFLLFLLTVLFLVLQSLGLVIYLLQDVSLAFYIFILVKAARPSVLQKRGAYWTRFEWAPLILFSGIILLQLMHMIFFGQNIQYLYSAFLWSIFWSNWWWLHGSHALAILVPYISPLSTLWVLFMLDARTSITEYIFAFFRALKLFFTDYPFFILTYLVLRLMILVGSLCSLLFHSSLVLPLIGWVVLYTVIIPYYLCVITNVYTKRIHEQFSRFYKR
jgi:hypothetical protein